MKHYHLNVLFFHMPTYSFKTLNNASKLSSYKQVLYIFGYEIFPRYKAPDTIVHRIFSTVINPREVLDIKCY